MSTLPKFTLIHDGAQGDWRLTEDVTERTVARFATKEEATRGGVLEAALGEAGGSVKIQHLDGTYEEERTFPRSADPRRSKG